MRKLKTEEIERIDIEEFKSADKMPLVVVLDNVRSLHNVGAVFRTSDAFRVEEVVLCGITATPPNAEIHKSALGAEFSVKWSYFKDTVDAVDELRLRGFEIITIEQTTDSVMLNEFVILPDRRYAVVLGNEVKGVAQQVIDMADSTIELPQFGTKHSLNVSVTAGIVIWTFAERLLLSAK